ncbi:MAG: acyl-CoA dehydratase activase-related protein [Lachnospiraceae bacterium]
MRITNEEPTQRQLTIGFPSALLYYRFEVLWKNFFASLGVKVITSQPTNKETLCLGSESAIDESCLSAKIYLGHVRTLIGKCDYILVPRISNWGRQRCMCTRFESLYDLVCNVFRDTGQKFLSYNVAVSKKLTEETAFLNLGLELGFPRKMVKEAYKTSRKKEASIWKAQIKEQENLYKNDGMKIVIAAHSYLIKDDYFGKPVIDYLKKLDTIPIRADITDRKEALKQSLKVSPTLKWEMSREIVGSLQMHREKIDGIILLTAFPCGPDSMVNEIITREFRDIPILTLVLDIQNGIAGIETRLESFVDILRFKKGGL